MVRTKTITKTETSGKMDATEVMKQINQAKAQAKIDDKEAKKNKRLQKEQEERAEGQATYNSLPKRKQKKLQKMAKYLGNLRKLELSMVIQQANFLKQCKEVCEKEGVKWRFFIEVLCPIKLSMTTASRRMGILKDVKNFEKIYGKGAIQKINTVQQMQELLDEATQQELQKADAKFKSMFDTDDEEDDSDDEEDEPKGDTDDEEEQKGDTDDEEDEPKTKPTSTKNKAKPTSTKNKAKPTSTKNKAEPTSTKNKKGSKVRTPKADETMGSEVNPKSTDDESEVEPDSPRTKERKFQEALKREKEQIPPTAETSSESGKSESDGVEQKKQDDSDGNEQKKPNYEIENKIEFALQKVLGHMEQYLEENECDDSSNRFLVAGTLVQDQAVKEIFKGFPSGNQEIWHFSTQNG